MPFLPLNGSLIAYDLILLAMNIHFQGKKITVKNALFELPHSQTGVRAQYTRLKNEGWLQVQPSDEDARIRHLLPTNKLIHTYMSLLSSI